MWQLIGNIHEKKEKGNCYSANPLIVTNLTRRVVTAIRNFHIGCFLDDVTNPLLVIKCLIWPQLLFVFQEWLSVVSTLGKVAQVDVLTSQSMENMETKARCLSLTGKYLRLLAVQEDPVYLCALWVRHDKSRQHKHSYIYTWSSCLLVCFIGPVLPLKKVRNVAPVPLWKVQSFLKKNTGSTIKR